MKLYPIALCLLLPFLAGAQTIPYQAEFLDVNPDTEGRKILELAAIGNRIYWGTDDDINYLSNGSVETTFSFQGGLGLRDGIEPLGNVGDLYYFHYNSGDKRYNFVINALVPVPEILELPLLEAEKWSHTEPVMAGDKLYAVREFTGADNQRIVQLIETDPVTEESTIVVTDTVTLADYPATQSMASDGGDLVYFTRPQDGGVGPAVYHADNGTLTNLGTLSAPDFVTYERVEERTLLRYRNRASQHPNTYFLTTAGLGPVVNGDVVPDQSIALSGALISIDTTGTLYATDYTSGSQVLLAEIGTAEHPHDRLFKLADDSFLFYRTASGGEWTVGLSNGTAAGTRDAVTVPFVDTDGPDQTVRLGSYVALISSQHPLYLFDPRNDDLQEVAGNFDLVGPNPPLASLGDRLYYAARVDSRGEQLHYLTIDDQRTLRGTAFDDDNGNGVQDTDERGIAHLLVTVAGSDGTEYLYTDENGDYALAVLDGETYTVTAHKPDCYQRTSSNDSYTVSVPADDYENLNFGYELQDGAADLTLYFSAGRVRCNTEAPFWITVRNDGCLPLAGTATVEFQDSVSFVSVSRDSVTETKNTITFTFDTLQPGELYHNAMKLQMPSEDLAGDTIVLTGSTAASYKNGQSLTDTVTFETELRCAVDPNDKQVFPYRADSTHSNYTEAGETLRYTIRFENMGNDTAFAVRVEDQLSEHLDHTTLLPLEASHPYEVTLSDAGLLTVNFPGIELVDSSVDAVASQGFVIFEIAPKEGLPEFTRIENKAGIYFDFNRPVITNTVVSTIVNDLDKDDDGVYFWEDCDDNDPSISPLAKEIPDNDIDENCDGVIEKVSATRNPLAGELAVFPNPTSQYLQLRYSGAVTLRARLLDVTGRQLQQRAFRQRVQLDLSAYPAGVYLLRVEDTTTGGTAQHRIVVGGR